MLHRIASRALVCYSSRSFVISSFRSSSLSSLSAFSRLSSSSFRSFSSMPSKAAPIVSESAQAVFKAAQQDPKSDAVNTVYQNITEFLDAYAEEPELRFVATDPTLSPEEKCEKFDELLGELQYHEVAQEIILYYVSIGQPEKLKEIAADYQKLSKFYRNEVLATITSAQELTAAQLTKVTAAIKSKLNSGEKLVLEQKVEPSIMGGMILQVGDEAVDLSVASQIKRIDQAIRQI